MAHPHLLPPDSLFSPSKVHQAASTSRDWSIIDTWLSTLYRQRHASSRPPQFERNPATLSALLSLYSAYESASEDHRLITNLNAEAHSQLTDHSNDTNNNGDPPLSTLLLTAIDDNLSRQGQTALTALSSLAVSTGTPTPTPADLARKFTTLQSQIFDTAQMIARTETLKQYIETEAIPESDALLEELSGGTLRPPVYLNRNIRDVEMRIKTEQAMLPELLHHVTEAEDEDGFEEMPSLDEIVKEEEEYMQLLAVKKELDATMAIFQGLPTDINVARTELNQIKAKLANKTRERDAMFENLVEQETPQKRR